MIKQSVNLQYNTLVRWADGTNNLLSKRLMFQVLREKSQQRVAKSARSSFIRKYFSCPLQFYTVMSSLINVQVCKTTKWLNNPSMYNMICWFAGPMGQTTHQARVWLREKSQQQVAKSARSSFIWKYFSCPLQFYTVMSSLINVQVCKITKIIQAFSF